MAEKSAFKLRVISPQGIFYEGEVNMLELYTTEGQIGIYKNHVPMTYVMVPGTIKIGEKKAKSTSGFVQILQEAVTVLVESAEWITQ